MLLKGKNRKEDSKLVQALEALPEGSIAPAPINLNRPPFVYLDGRTIRIVQNVESFNSMTFYVPPEATNVAVTGRNNRGVTRFDYAGFGYQIEL